MAKYNLKFPVFIYGSKEDKKMLFPFFSLETLSTFSPSLFKKEFYENDEVIDSSGNVYHVKDAIFVKYIGWNRHLPFCKKYKRILASYDYEDKVEKITLSAFKELIIPMVQQSSEIWDESYGTTDKLIRLISTAPSFEEIADLLY